MEHAITEVLFEQLEYLLGHKSGPCPQDCRECARLAYVKQILLAPFRSNLEQQPAQAGDSSMDQRWRWRWG